MKQEETSKHLFTLILQKDIITIKNNSDLIMADIFDLNGRKILSASSKRTDISRLTSGQYLIRSTFKDGSTNSQN